MILVALGASAIYGLVLERLQWQVLRRRIPMLRMRKWIVATLVPDTVGSVTICSMERLRSS